MLSGGSAFGLEAGGGAMQYLEERGVGFDVGVGVVPLVCGASLFDLVVGDPKCRPDKKMGYEACEAAGTDEVAQGNVGAGTGATVGKYLGIDRMIEKWPWYLCPPDRECSMRCHCVCKCLRRCYGL